MKSFLHDSSTDSEVDQDHNKKEPNEIVINEEYAKRYEYSKRKQELAMLKEKHAGADEASDDSDSDTTETEDEDGQEMTPAVDVELMKTIAAIRSKDPTVYDPSMRFFQEEQMRGLDQDAFDKKVVGDTSSSSSKPLYLREYQKEQLLAGDYLQDPKANEPVVMSHNQEQEMLRQELKKAIKKEEDADTDDLFTMKTKTEEDQTREEVEYKDWVLMNLKSDERFQKAFPAFVSKDSSQQSDIAATEGEEKKDGDQFLADFILNRGWVDKSAKTKNPLASDSENDNLDAIDEEDDEFMSEAEQFEQQYNFRYEQIEQLHGAGASYNPALHYGLTSHARDIPQSVRRKDTTRADKRKEREERKQAEKQQKREEIKRLKNLKRKELEEKIEKIQRWSGVKIDPNTVDMEKLESIVAQVEENDDFDMDKWDELMGDMFSDTYYKQSESKKPVFSDNENEDLPEEIVKEFDYNQNDGDEESDIDMDADFMDGAIKYEEPPLAEAEVTTEDIKDIKRIKSEYEKLDVEDFVAGLPTRFRYRQVENDSFGLKPEEILEADDVLLNEFLSLKRLAPYRTRPLDKQWLDKWKSKGKKRRRELRMKLQELRAGPEAAAPSEKRADKKDKKRSRDSDKLEKREKKHRTTDSSSKSEDTHEVDDSSNQKTKKKKETKINLKQERLSAYGL